MGAAPNTAEPRTLDKRPYPPPSPYRWAWYVPGFLAVAWGVYGLLSDRQGPEPLSYAVFVALAIIGHDLVLAPVAVVAGWLFGRVAPPLLRAPLQVGLFGTAVLLLAATPYLSGQGVSADLPSALPFDYRARVLVLLAVLWAGMLVWIAVRFIRSRRTAEPADQG